MGISSKTGPTEQRARLARLARLAERQAFENYLRRGRVSDLQTRLADANRTLSRKALGDPRPTNYYTWRTARDERVRSAHAANDGHVFSWSAAPATGHPGHEFNCRCWAEPYYGTPMVPDATLALRREFHVDVSGREHWASIETQIRPDGSLARSTVALRDSSSIQSSFVGSHVTHTVQLPSGQSARVERRDGVQSVLPSSTSVPILRSIWTPEGPKTPVARRRTAQGLASPTLRPGNEFDEIELVDPSRLGQPSAEAALGAAAGLALLGLYNMLTAKPESLGAGSGAVPAVAFRVWPNDKNKDPSAVALAALTAE